MKGTSNLFHRVLANDPTNAAAQLILIDGMYLFTKRHAGFGKTGCLFLNKDYMGQLIPILHAGSQRYDRNRRRIRIGGIIADYDHRAGTACATAGSRS